LHPPLNGKDANLTKSETAHRSILDRVSSGAAFMAGLAVLALTVMITFDVLMRYFLNQPQLFVDELASFLLVGIIFWGASQTFQKGGHIRVDLITNQLSPKVQRVLRIITLAIGIIFLAIVTCETVNSSVIAYRQERVSAVMIYPLWLPMLLIPIGLALMMLVMATSLIREYRRPSQERIEAAGELPAESDH
jgi:TRAP-type C4-dicarboxylate transport system permease small subunit